MSLSSDNFTAAIHLRDQARKWKNIAFLMIIAIILLVFRVLFGSSDNVNRNIDVGDYIASVTIDGIIMDDDYRNEVLEKIAKQENIKAVIVNIDSPGGGIVGSENLYELLSAIAKTKPIVTVMGSVATSGGYMASLASDHIIARNGSLTGSIGVIIQASEFTNLANKMGVQFLTYKSSPLKGTPSPFEKANPEADRVINESIKDSYKFFADLVKQRRGDKIKGNFARVTDGRIFTGRQALEAGLIDEIGGKAEAVSYLKTAHKIDTDKFPVKKVNLEKPNKGFLTKFVGEESMTKIIQKLTGFNVENKQLMSVW